MGETENVRNWNGWH